MQIWFSFYTILIDIFVHLEYNQRAVVPWCLCDGWHFGKFKLYCVQSLSFKRLIRILCEGKGRGDTAVLFFCSKILSIMVMSLQKRQSGLCSPAFFRLTQSALFFTDFTVITTEQGCINGTDIKENNSFTQGYFHQIWLWGNS